MNLHLPIYSPTHTHTPKHIHTVYKVIFLGGTSVILRVLRTTAFINMLFIFRRKVSRLCYFDYFKADFGESVILSLV